MDLDRQVSRIPERSVRPRGQESDPGRGAPPRPLSRLPGDAGLADHRGLAQTGGILVGEAGGFVEKVVLAKIPRAEFFGVACAGDQLIYEVTI